MIFILTSHAVVVTGGKGGGLWLPGFSGGCGSRGYSRSLYCEAPVQKCREMKKIVQLWLAIISSTEWPPVRIWWHAVGLVGGFSIMTTMPWLSDFSLRLPKHLLHVRRIMISSASRCSEHQNLRCSSNGTFGQKTDFWHCACNVWFIGKTLSLETKPWIFLCCCLPSPLKRPRQIYQVSVTTRKITIILQILTFWNNPKSSK